MPLIDTHCHLSYPDFDADREASVTRAAEAGVTRFVNVATGPDCWEKYLALARADARVRVTLGFHPNDTAESYTSARFEELKALVTQERALVVAIGETGLDFFRDNSGPEIQAQAFRAQLGLADETGLPFILHCRKAERAMLDELTAHRERTGRALNGVWHCFTATPAFMREAVELGLYLGFGGVLTYPKAEEVRQAAREAPADRLLLETDAPFLAPQTKRGKRNEPAFVAETAKMLAEVRGLTFEALSELTTQNAHRLFKL